MNVKQTTSNNEKGGLSAASDKSGLISQPKFSVSTVNAPLEYEADTMAGRVMRMPEPNFIQRKYSCGEDEEAQRKPLTSFIQKKESGRNSHTGDEDEEEVDEEEDMDGMELPEPVAIQKKDRGTGDAEIAGHEVSEKIRSTKGGGDTLPLTTRNYMENRFGADFSSVRIHRGEYASKLSDQLNAQAFTTGNDIYFNSGKYTPGTEQGNKLIAHELTHTIQQGSSKIKSSPVVQRSFWGGIKKAAGAVWGGIKQLGSWIGTGAKKIWSGLKWFGGQLIDKIAGVFQRFAFWMTQLPVRVYRFFSGLWKGLKTFKPWTKSWWKSLAEADTWKNFLKWITTAALQALEIGGIGEAYETIQDIVKFNTRTLSAGEINAGKSIFGTSINFDFVRVDTGAVIGPLFSDRAYTSFHTINSWGTESTDIMMHELTHVWQYENAGAIYMPQAVHAQVWGGGYNYGGVAGLQASQAAGKGFLSFNREQQAQIVQDFYLLRQNGYAPRTSATPADLPLYVSFVKTVSSLDAAVLSTPV